MRTSTIIISVLFAAFMFVALIIALNERGPAALAYLELRHAAGLFLAAAAGLFLLTRAVAGDSPSRLVSFVLPFFAGVLLIEPHWGVALGLAAATVTAALRPWLAGPTRHLPATPPPHSPPVL